MRTDQHRLFCLNESPYHHFCISVKMFFTWLIFILALFGVIAFGLIIFARWNYGKLDNLGFPIIPPSGIRGSIPNIHHKVQHYEDIKRFEENGPIWGVYML